MIQKSWNSYLIQISYKDYIKKKSCYEWLILLLKRTRIQYCGLVASVRNDETGEIASHRRAGDTIMLLQDGDSLIWHINML